LLLGSTAKQIFSNKARSVRPFGSSLIVARQYGEADFFKQSTIGATFW
jgi:hypothetical protein